MATNSRIGWRPYVTQVVNAVDADATAFIAAAGITNLTQAAAISTLVNDLKTYGLWTKMKALYPMVGGSATSHKFNLKDPRDLDAAYRLVFNGGWVHTTTGALPNGTTGYADTKLSPINTLGLNSTHISYYSRTQTTDDNKTDIGCSSNANELPIMQMYIRRSNAVYSDHYDYTNNRIIASNTDTTGLFLATRTSNVLHKVYRNSSLLGSDTNASTQNVLPGTTMTIAAYQRDMGIFRYSTKESAFASIGDGLTDTEATNFYNSVQKFQTTLGRQIGSPIVSDTDAQAFINAAGLTDLGQANAVNTLVVDLKAAGVWTKMKALYPFVGGTATAHKFNLKDPRDLNEAFRLVFSGGWVHSATGALPNGTTGYGNTFLVPSNNFPISQYDAHISLYSRTNIEAPTTNWLSGSIGVDDDYNSAAYFILNVNSKTTRIVQGRTLGNQWTTYSGPLDDSRGFFIINKQNNTTLKLKKNDTLLSSNTTLSTAQYRPAQNFYIGAVNGSQSYSGLNYDNKEYGFISIGNGLTDTEASAFYTAVQKYQTSLSRQIGTPVLAEGQTAGLLETYSGAAAAYSLRKLRTGYYGAAIRVRRSSDNGEQDITFKADGTLDTTSLLAFVGSGDGFVTTWYDQSGNGLHFAQSTAANQPSIVINSAVVLTFGEPAVRFNSVNKNYLEIPSSTSSFNFLHNGTDSTIISVARYFFTTNPISDSVLISNGGGGSATVGTWVGFSDTSPNNNAFGVYITRGVGGIGDGATHTAQSIVSDTALPFTKQNLHFVNINASAAAIDRIKVQYDNNTIAKNNIRSNTPSTANSTNNMMMGVYVQGGVKYHALEGDVQELIIYNSNQDANRTGIKTNINSFYSIY
jgi:hypothetical protein